LLAGGIPAFPQTETPQKTQQKKRDRIHEPGTGGGQGPGQGQGQQQKKGGGGGAQKGKSPGKRGGRASR
jgi:hypothetical protein